MTAPLPAALRGTEQSLPAAGLGGSVVVGAGSFALLAAAGAAQGAYFPGAWGWLAIACVWAAVLVLIARPETSLPPAAVVALGLFAALAVWIVASAAWTVNLPQTGLEAQRALVYVAAVAAALVVARGSHVPLLAGIWAGIVALTGYGLLTRLLPDRLGVTDSISGYRLAVPIGYTNSLGLLAAMGALLALGLAARAAGLARAVLAGASVVPLVAALYFTFSRGAWIALGIGIVATFALEARRLQLLAVLAAVVPPGALVIVLAARLDALTTIGSPIEEMTREGHRLALALLPLAVLAGAGVGLARVLERRIAVPERTRLVLGRGLLVALAAAVAAVFLQFGAPWTLAERGWAEFSRYPTAATSANLNARLFQLSGSGRVDFWDVAWRQWRDHPVLGSGAGTYERFWYRDRPDQFKVRDAHNLYLETLAELGPIGLALLLALLVVPAVAAARARRAVLVAPAFGAYAAFVAHAGVDWHWELVVVTLAALLVAAGLLVSGSGRAVSIAGRGRLAAIAVAAALAAAALYSIATHVAAERVDGAALRGDWAAAGRAADRAAALAPWSTAPWRSLAERQIEAHRFADARGTLRRALARDPGDWALWLALAKASDGVERASALDRAEGLNPNSPEVAWFRATLVSLSDVDVSR